MANKNKARSQNVTSNFFVDNTCIDCGTCYWIAPEIFSQVDGMSAVINDVHNDQTKINAARALYSCPTNSIGVFEKDPTVLDQAREAPYLVDENVYHTGFHSRDSYGAASYLIKRSDGNFLIDSPRYTKNLATKFATMGGVKFHLLTHRDDIADTDKYFEHWQGSRIIHKDDCNDHTSTYERFISGYETIRFSDDLLIIPTPGHTKGSVCFLYQNKYLFTGDHLAFSAKLDHLYAFKTACWYDFDIQITSMERLLDYDFEYVLPGHGAPFNAGPSDMKQSLKDCIKWMKN